MIRREENLQQIRDEDSRNGGSGPSQSKLTQRPEKTRDQAQERDGSKTTEEWENDKLPKKKD